MGYHIYLIPVYFLILMIFNFYRAKKVKSQEDFMVAGRSLSTPVLAFTLICTWIGSVAFIAGAEFSCRAGFSALWLAAGAWAGIVVIYFLAGRIRTFGQYTIGDILGGAIVCVGLKVLSAVLPTEMAPEGDPFGIPLIYPSIMVSLLCLIIGSYLTRSPSEKELDKIFKRT